MNYRLLLSEMLIDYSERRNKELNLDKRKVYTEIIRDLMLALDIEPGMQEVIQNTKKLLK
jgi:hypothetical protein